MTTQRWAPLVLLVCCALAAIEGFDLQAPGLTAPAVGRLFALTAPERGWFLSISTFGLMLGALIGGTASDRFGRRTPLVFSVCAFGLFSLLTGAAHGYPGLLWGRFLTGLGLGGALPNLLAIVSEGAGPQARHGRVALLYASMPTGGALASLVSALAHHPGDWRLIFVVGGVAPLAVAVAGAGFLPVGAARARAEPRAPVRILHTLFGQGRASTTWLLWAAFFTALLAMYLLLGWLPSLMISKGLAPSAASITQIAFNLAGAGGSLLVGWAMDRFSRPWVVGLSFLAAILAASAIAVDPAAGVRLLVEAAALGAAVSATQAIVYSLAPLAYPTGGRGTGVGVAVAVGRLGSAAGPLLGGLLLGLGASEAGVLGALVPVLALAGATCATLIARAPFARIPGRVQAAE